MQLSDWQLSRLRNALRAYHHYESSHDGDSFTWKDVSEAIDEYTGEHIPPERLRQFVAGFKQDDGRVKFPTPRGDRLRAIFNFATESDIGLLTVKELEERKIDIQAAIRLLEYLDQDFDDVRIVPPETIAGTYQLKKSESDALKISKFIFEKPLEMGIIKVTQTDKFYDPSTHDPETAKCLSQVNYSGWAILSPEDNLFLFLKNVRNGRNRYYFSIASDLKHSLGGSVNYLGFLHHDYPVEINQKRRPESLVDTQMIDHINKNLQLFMKK